MLINETLYKIRKESSTSVTIQQKILQVALSFSFGILLGFIIKYSDTIPSNEFMGSFWSTISEISSRLGIWVLLATIITVYSDNPRIGAIKVFVFFTGMMLIYYFYSMKLFGFFPTYYFIRWGLIALASSIGAYILWFSRGKGWIAALCSAIPISLLVTEGYPFFYIFDLTLGLDILFTFILFLILPMNKIQRLRTFTWAILIVFILIKSDVQSYLFGGL